jgi:hypothetical protein
MCLFINSAYFQILLYIVKFIVYSKVYCKSIVITLIATNKGPMYKHFSSKDACGANPLYMESISLKCNRLSCCNCLRWL